MGGSIGTVTYYENYSPVGDVTVTSVCLVFFILMAVAYNIKSKSYRIMQAMIVCLLIAAAASMGYHITLNKRDEIPYAVIYLLRFLMHTGLFVNLYLYVIYVMEPLQLDANIRKRFFIADTVLLVMFVADDLFSTIFKFGYYIDETGTIHEGVRFFFAIGYCCFFGIIAWLLLVYRGRIVRQILYGILGTFAMSILMMSIQGAHGQVSFTCVCFLYPIVTLLYMIHANPYDIEIGAVNVNAFDDMIGYVNRHHESRFFMSLFMPDFEGTGKKYPIEIQNTIKEFTQQYFRGAVLFKLSGGRMLLSINMKKNPDYKKGAESALKRFAKEYKNFQFDYKIVFLTTVPSITGGHDYIKLLQFIEKKMDINSVHTVADRDIADYTTTKYVLSELEDIRHGADLNDPRIEVFTQPVLNIATGKYDTAEALMRMRLPETGMVFPDVFIPLAEEYNYIHTLSLIILFKTCIRIKNMLDQGYNVQRISVNFSVGELRDKSFCDDVKRVIDKVGVPYDKIAIEITESQNESDFLITKKRINELRHDGIKFYLDDFGTGYSNFERIMELPFDIIKFDRSLVIACGSDEKSEQMVTHLARMFSSMDYSVLYEGVETEQDEQKCIRMSAKYLQGYKYSKPIPIEELSEWFEKTA
ncbi:MAG: EAL domain-containing protein [Eubacterium sp.]|nr:EAL domain-containing protein [Eubacterium sp.]